jgi:hypothetical protein
MSRKRACGAKRFTAGESRPDRPHLLGAYNDLAVGYEHEGQLDKARQAMKKLSRSIPATPRFGRTELFKEINDRTASAKEHP